MTQYQILLLDYGKRQLSAGLQALIEQFIEKEPKLERIKEFCQIHEIFINF
jgi:5,10-methylenetetrahydrofolate reductase